MSERPLRSHAEASATINASPERLFDYLDDYARLGAHMEKPSMMMMGGRMTYEFDETKGRAVGAAIKMGGRFLGVGLSVEEVVVERAPPRRKVWETRGRPRLIVIGAYRMGFDVTPAGEGSSLRVFIDYDRTPSLTGRILSRAFGPIYARWCVKRMAEDAERHFPKPTGTA
jgi:hypothetical protein